MTIAPVHLVFWFSINWPLVAIFAICAARYIRQFIATRDETKRRRISLAKACPQFEINLKMRITAPRTWVESCELEQVISGEIKATHNIVQDAFKIVWARPCYAENVGETDPIMMLHLLCGAAVTLSITVVTCVYRPVGNGYLYSLEVSSIPWLIYLTTFTFVSRAPTIHGLHSSYHKQMVDLARIILAVNTGVGHARETDEQYGSYISKPNNSIGGGSVKYVPVSSRAFVMRDLKVQDASSSVLHYDENGSVYNGVAKFVL